MYSGQRPRRRAPAQRSAQGCHRDAHIASSCRGGSDAHRKGPRCAAIRRLDPALRRSPCQAPGAAPRARATQSSGVSEPSTWVAPPPRRARFRAVRAARRGVANRLHRTGPTRRPASGRPGLAAPVWLAARERTGPPGTRAKTASNGLRTPPRRCHRPPSRRSGRRSRRTAPAGGRPILPHWPCNCPEDRDGPGAETS